MKKLMAQYGRTLFSLLALSLCLSCLSLTTFAQEKSASPITPSLAAAEAAKKPEIIQLTNEETEQLKTWFERVKQLAAESDQAKTLAEKAISDFNAAQGQLEAARAMRTALFYKLCAEKKIDPATVELTADGIMKKPTTEKKTSAHSLAPQPAASHK